MNLRNSNFSEQAAWVSVFFTLFIGLYYGNGVIGLDGTFATHPEQIVWLWVETIIVSIIFVIIAFAALMILKQRNNDDDIDLIDERDEAIEHKATMFAYINLNACIVFLIIHVFCLGLFPDYPFFISIPPLDFLIHGLMFSGLFVEFVLRATQIFRYRQTASFGESYE